MYHRNTESLIWTVLMRNQYFGGSDKFEFWEILASKEKLCTFMNLVLWKWQFEAWKSELQNSPNSSYLSNLQVFWIHISKSDFFIAKNIFEQMKIKDRCFYLRINSILTIVPKCQNSLFYVRIWDLGNTRLLSYLKHQF